MSTKKPAFDPYKEITDRIIEALEAGPGEWVKPWKTLGTAGMPHNGGSKRPYRGLNVWLLALAGFGDARWYTYRQATELKAQVRKGEKSTKVFFWYFKSFDETQPDGSVKTKKVPLLKVYSVFNAQQIDGLPGVEPAPGIDPIGEEYASVAALLTKHGASVGHGGDRAFYRPSEDRIQMPVPGSFDSLGLYWSTLLHEYAHWTGHTSRLNRQITNRFGDDAYAMEELVAELGSAFLCARLGVAGEMRHPEYLANWLKVLRGDKYAVFSAAREAQKAADFILGAGSESEEESSEDAPSGSGDTSEASQSAAFTHSC